MYLLCFAGETKQLEHNENSGCVQIRAEVFKVFRRQPFLTLLCEKPQHPHNTQKSTQNKQCKPNKCITSESWSLFLRPNSQFEVYLNVGTVFYLLCTYYTQHLTMQPNLVKYLNICSTSKEGVTSAPLMYIVQVKFMPGFTQHLQP